MAMEVAPQERQLGMAYSLVIFSISFLEHVFLLGVMNSALSLWINYSEWRSVESAGVFTILAAAADSFVSAHCSSCSAQAK